MGRKFRIALSVFVILLIAAFVGLFFFVRDIDPPYQGKRLSAWAKEIVPWQGPNTPEATTLLNHGSNATPLIALMLNARDSDLKKRILDLISKQHAIKINAQYQPASTTQMGGLKAAIVLGPQARGAIPALSALLGDYPARVKDPAVAECAVYVLAMMGPDGIHGLLQALTNQNPAIRIKAAQVLGPAPASVTPEVVDALGKCVVGNDPALQSAAKLSLEIIKRRQAQHISQSATQWSESADSPPDPPSVWDMKRGTARIRATGGLVPGFYAEDMFGTRQSTSGTGETGTTIFPDNLPDGTVNWVEWETPSPVTVRSFGLVGFHQPADQWFERSFRSFRLFAWNESEGKYATAYSEEIPVPYGNGYFSSLLFLFRNFDAPVTARRFKAEFVQNGAGAYFGPRVIALYGFTNTLNLPTAIAALQNQPTNTLEEGRRFLTQQALAPK